MTAWILKYCKGKIIEKNKDNAGSTASKALKRKKMSVNETLLYIQRDKEERRKRRHAERMKVLKSFIKMFSKSNDEIDFDSE